MTQFHPYGSMKLIFISVFVLSIFISYNLGISQEVIGNIESDMYHHGDCHHLPAIEKQMIYNTIDAAESSGLHPCPICFRPNNNIEDYELERSLGIETAAKVRYYWPLSVNPEYQQRVERVGSKVLANWPYELKAYQYKFRVVESEVFNAYTCPTGFIFITDTLLESLESEEELEAVLAHEITHVDNRDGYNIYKKMQDASLFASLAGAAVGILSGSPTAFEIAESLTLLAQTIVLFGYSREQEQKADLTAFYYFDNQKRNISDNILMVLNKLEDLGDGKESSILSTHPDIDNRIMRIKTLMEFNELLKEANSNEFFIGTINVDEIQKSEGSFRKYDNLRKKKPILIITGSKITIINDLEIPLSPYYEYKFEIYGSESENSVRIKFDNAFYMMRGKHQKKYYWSFIIDDQSLSEIYSASEIKLVRKAGPRGFKNIITFNRDSS